MRPAPASALSLLLACGPAAPGPPAIGDVDVSLHAQMGSILAVRWTQGQPATSWLEFRVAGEDWLRSPPEARPAGAAAELALGLPFGAPVEVRVATASETSAVVALDTAPLPEGAPQNPTVSGDPARWDSDAPYVLLAMRGFEGEDIDGAWAAIVDRAGRAVWLRAADHGAQSMHIQLSHDGTEILFDQNTFWGSLSPELDDVVLRLDIEGTLLEEIVLPGLQHPFAELPGGRIAWTALEGSFSTGYFDEDTVQLRHPDGSIEALWSCAGFRAAEGITETGGLDGQSPCGSNNLEYDDARGVLLYSSFTMSTMVEIDAQTGAVVRYYGHAGEGWAFAAPEQVFDFQHGGHYTDHGTLLVSSDAEGEDGSETVLIEYTVDEDAQLLAEVRRLGAGSGLHAVTMGEGDYTPSGNVLQNMGSLTRLREHDPDGAVVWDVDWDGGDRAAGFNADGQMARSTPLGDLYALKR